MEVIEPTVIPTYEDRVTDLLDNLAKPESDPVQVPTKVAENLDSEITSKVLTNESASNSTSEVKPLGAKDSLKGGAGVTKRGKKKKKKKIPEVEPDNSRPYVIEKLEALGFSKWYSGSTYHDFKQCFFVIFVAIRIIIHLWLTFMLGIITLKSCVSFCVRDLILGNLCGIDEDWNTFL